jgi:monoterpene epsilon-lactone hydrolase
MRKLVKLTSRMFLNSKCPLWLQRKGLNILGGYARLPDGIKETIDQLANRPVRWFAPVAGNSQHVILYLHGGGYGIGSPRSHRDLCAHLAKYAQMSVASLDYRLAPEHPYPAAIEDALAAYQALLNEGHNNKQIYIAGDSAGGSLALTLVLRLKSMNIPQPAALFLISPWINKSRQSASHHTQLDVDPVINESWSSQMTDNYFQNSTSKQAEACLYDKDLSGLPPMLIHVGTDEVLLDDSLILKQHAIKAGIRVTLITYSELWHVFHFSASLFKQARTALKQAGNFLVNLMQ